MTDQDDAAPGWDAIDAACARLSGDQTPRHVGYQPPAAFSANLQGCSAYDAGGHWHYVSYGLSDLFETEPDPDSAFSGWGFELTMRVASTDDGAAPAWPFTMINEMAKHVNTNRVLLEAGDRISIGGPVTGHPSLPDAPDTDLTVLALVVDPQMGRIDTPNGAVEFLQLVGVTATDFERMVASTTDAVLEERRAADPLLVLRP